MAVLSNIDCNKIARVPSPLPSKTSSKHYECHRGSDTRGTSPAGGCRNLQNGAGAWPEPRLG